MIRSKPMNEELVVKSKKGDEKAFTRVNIRNKK